MHSPFSCAGMLSGSTRVVIPSPLMGPDPDKRVSTAPSHADLIIMGPGPDKRVSTAPPHADLMIMGPELDKRVSTGPSHADLIMMGLGADKLLSRRPSQAGLMMTGDESRQVMMEEAMSLYEVDLQITKDGINYYIHVQYNFDF